MHWTYLPISANLAFASCALYLFCLRNKAVKTRQRTRAFNLSLRATMWEGRDTHMQFSFYHLINRVNRCGNLILASFSAAVHESRRQQAAQIIHNYRHLIDDKSLSIDLKRCGEPPHCNNKGGADASPPSYRAYSTFRYGHALIRKMEGTIQAHPASDSSVVSDTAIGRHCILMQRRFLLPD